jgi:Family of unknown function (DUF5630)
MKHNLTDELKKVKLLQLTPEELTAIREIGRLPEKEDKQIGNILNKYCQSVLAFVRIAIYNPKARKWCRENNQTQWREYLDEISKFETFACEFKTPKKLPIFDLLAGLMLTCEYLDEQKSEKKIVILYVAMEVFNSFHAACTITRMAVTELKTGEKELKSMTKALEKFAPLHGCPGYLLYSWFTRNIGEHLLEQKKEKAASGALHLGYQFLLTAARLEKESAPEIHNAAYGDIPHFLSIIDSSPQTFPSMISNYENRFSAFISPIKLSAQQTASDLTRKWMQYSHRT